MRHLKKLFDQILTELLIMLFNSHIEHFYTYALKQSVFDEIRYRFIISTVFIINVCFWLPTAKHKKQVLFLKFCQWKPCFLSKPEIIDTRTEFEVLKRDIVDSGKIEKISLTAR